MVAIITGTIKPDNGVRQLSLRNADERLEQYRESLKFFLESGAFSKIIFCENSNQGEGVFSDLFEKAEKHQVQLELHSFQGDTQKAGIHGKGYGEGEIMNYVMEHSKLLQRERFFVKITGRLKIDNIREIVLRLKEDRLYFNVPNVTRKDIYDTRFYGMPVKQFEQFFRDKYSEIMDDEGVFLETVYTRIILDHQIKISNFPKYPRIVGMSGSSGAAYGYTEWKCRIKDMISMLGGYKVKG
ncbi:MAG: hypothetical protein IJP31_10645 [Lachnospiraceae bacterium]|nr:hypothetical protein [Lachnospiraceae bacterium]